MDEVSKMTPEQAMLRAIEEAKKGFGFVSPNPPVGCVILDKNYNFLSSGYHKKLGEDHAEVDALKKIINPEKLKGAHVFVTLEPCAHEGRTPSCAKTLATLPIESVTYGLKDPNPLVEGKGLKILLAAGIHVDCYEGLSKELESLAEIFLLNMREQKCFIALKVASSIDGQIALSSGESQWITNSKSRQHSHDLRGVYDATAVGFGTYKKDNPSLNIRHGKYANKNNHKVVLFDKNAESLNSINKSNLLKANKPENVYIVVDKKHKNNIENNYGINILYIEHNEGPKLSELHKCLLENKIYSLYIEGGSKVLSYFITKKLFNSLYVFIGSKLLGKGLSWTNDIVFSSLSNTLSLKLSHVETFESDILLKYNI